MGKNPDFFFFFIYIFLVFNSTHHLNSLVLIHIEFIDMNFPVHRSRGLPHTTWVVNLSLSYCWHLSLGEKIWIFFGDENLSVFSPKSWCQQYVNDNPSFLGQNHLKLKEQWRKASVNNCGASSPRPLCICSTVTHLIGCITIFTKQTPS